MKEEIKRNETVGLLALPRELQEHIIQYLFDGFHVRACSVLERRLVGVTTATLRQLPWRLISRHDILDLKLTSRHLLNVCKAAEAHYTARRHLSQFGGTCLLPNPDLLKALDEETRYTESTDHPSIEGVAYPLQLFRTLLDRVHTFELPDDNSWQHGRRYSWISTYEIGPNETEELVGRFPQIKNIVMGFTMNWPEAWSPAPCTLDGEYWLKHLSGRQAKEMVCNAISQWLPREAGPKLLIRFTVTHGHGIRGGVQNILVSRHSPFNVLLCHFDRGSLLSSCAIEEKFVLS